MSVRAQQSERARSVAVRSVVWLTMILACLALSGVFATRASAVLVTCTLDRGTVRYGQTVTVTGTVEGAIAGDTVTIALDGTLITTALTDDLGQFSAAFVPLTGGIVTATSADASVGPDLPLIVLPNVTTSVGKMVPFGRSVLTLIVDPPTYRGAVVARIWHHNKIVKRVRFTVRAERTVLRLPTKGVGRFRVELLLAADAGLGARSEWVIMDVPWRRVAVGTQGADVGALLRRIKWLRFRIPGESTKLSFNASQSLIAFQKAHGLSRDGVFGRDDWHHLDTAKRIKPKYTSPTLHIEVDKTRQILMVVKSGAVLGIIPVSTGATGNTPEGSFSILRKNLTSTALYGSAILFRSMTFHGNFAIHGYPDVPVYPASHGCVREPEWVADWVYDQTVVGERVYVYH